MFSLVLLSSWKITDILHDQQFYRHDFNQQNTNVYNPLNLRIVTMEHNNYISVLVQ